MGIERVVTDSMVFEVADQLTAKGEKVTNRAIWSAVGGGSMTTISQALRRWKDSQVLQVAQPIERAPLPAPIIDVLHGAAAQLWDAALAETKSELDQLAQATNARVAEAQSERDDTLTELQTTAEELEQVKAERDGALAEIDRKVRQLETSAIEIAKLQAELKAQTEATTAASHRAETAEAARAELQARVEQISSLLSGEQTARQQAETDANALHAVLSKQTAELEAGNRRAADIEARANAHALETANEITAIKAERQELQTMLKALVDKIGWGKVNGEGPDSTPTGTVNKDALTDESLSKAKPTPVATKRRKTEK
jgi:myosin heavy subunit